VQGRATRVLHDAGVWSRDDVGRRLSRALSAGQTATDGAAFVEGLVAGSGTVLVHDTDLLGTIDDWLAALPADAFDTVVPLLRRTFGAFEPAERRQLGQLLSGRPGEATSHHDDGFDPDLLAAAANVAGTLLGLPPRDDQNAVH